MSAVPLDDATFAHRPGRPALMGIVNASPESFFDGGRLPDVGAQAAHGLRLAEDGAAIVDVGGESGVTHLPPVSVAEEIRRVVPVIERLAAEGVKVSVDTWKAPVARAALDAGAALVNDPSGLCDPALAVGCAERGAGLVITHTRVRPKVKAFPSYGDVVGDVIAVLAERVELAMEVGVAPERIAVDPGLDLAKTPGQSVEVLRRLEELHALGRPILLATSRKDFVGALTGRSPAARLGGTLAAVEAAACGGVAVLRVHDVGAVADYLTVRAAVRGEAEVQPGLHLPARLRRERAAVAS